MTSLAQDIPLDKRAFQKALEQLRATYGASPANEGSYQSDTSVRCQGCMFTTASEDCFQCTYCDACVECSDCTHCTRTTQSTGSSYCVDAHHCVRCSYVVLSQHCYECVFCFGCVGLSKKEFHILNVPFKRKVYFELVAELKEALGMA